MNKVTSLPSTSLHLFLLKHVISTVCSQKLECSRSLVSFLFFKKKSRIKNQVKLQEILPSSRLIQYGLKPKLFKVQITSGG